MEVQICTKQVQVSIDDTKLDIVCSQFGDRIFLLVTELQKMGSLLEVRRDQVAASPAFSYSVTTLLGKDEAEVHVFGRAIAAHLALPASTPLLLGLGLRRHSPQLIPRLLHELESVKVWDTKKS